MILVDTSIWIDHLRSPHIELRRHLEAAEVVLHPAVLGEIVLGRIADRSGLRRDLALLPRPAVATDAEVLDMVDRHDLSGSGIGWVDAHLLASTLITAGARLWTRDRRLDAVATRLGVARTDA